MVIDYIYDDLQWYRMGSDRVQSATPHVNSDMYAAWVDSTGQVVVVDGFSNSFDMPVDDTQQDGVPISGSVLNGKPPSFGAGNLILVMLKTT